MCRARARAKVWGQTHGSDPSSSLCALDRRVEDAEPAGQVLLHRQLWLELRLQLQLLGVVPLLALAGRDERPEGAALVAVDPVHRVLAAVELEDRGEELRAEALFLQALSDRVHRRDLIFELRVADDDPRVAELVLATLQLRAGVAGDAVEQLLQVVLRADEIAG